jgi:tRNA dimethylallyltransferase
LRKLPILCGGTNLYIHSVLKSYQLGEVNFDSDEFQFLMEQNEDELKDILLRENENLHNTTDLNDKIRIAKAIIISRSKSKEIIRPKINSLNICIDLPRNNKETKRTFSKWYDR